MFQINGKQNGANVDDIIGESPRLLGRFEKQARHAMCSEMIISGDESRWMQIMLRIVILNSFKGDARRRASSAG